MLELEHESETMVCYFGAKVSEQSLEDLKNILVLQLKDPNFKKRLQNYSINYIEQVS